MKRLPILMLWITLLAQCPSGQAENIVYPEDVRAVINVTHPPYNADPTGQRDCTAALIQAMDDIVQRDRTLLKQTIAMVRGQRKDVYRADEIEFAQRQRILRENPDAVIGFERCSGIFPMRNPPSRILYFPNGTYRVSDTICYSFKDLQNAIGMEFNRCLHFQGQSEQGVVIRLEDRAPGFGPEANKPVISFMRGSRSNVSMQNTCENLTIDIGSGNPGAVGLHFFANNTGAVRHVTVRSSDPQNLGRAGVAVTTFNSSCVLLQHLTVEGCDYGIDIGQHRLYTVIEHASLRHQRQAGFRLTDHNVAARGLISHNRVPAVTMKGPQATLALVDCRFIGGEATQSAIDFRAGFLMARNITTAGYETALNRAEGPSPAGLFIDEYVSHPCPRLFKDSTQRSLSLPVVETPVVPWQQDPSQWISVNACGARGNGLTDDTRAIQAAMDTGKPVVYFQPGVYLINDTIRIGSEVQRVNFMYSDLVAGGELQTREGQGTFQVVGESDQPLLIEDLFAFERYFGAQSLIDHASRRTLILSDLHVQVGACYHNTVSGGKVFIENICTTDQFPPFKNCFSFTDQKVWARQLNPERADPEVLNDGSQLWVLGFKTEKSGTAFKTVAGGATEVLGGIFNICRSETSSPIIDTHDASVSVFASTTDHRERPAAWNVRPLVQETRQGETRSLNWNQLPRRDRQLIVMPLYTGRGAPR